MKVLEEVLKKGVAGLIPVYKDMTGNATELITSTGENYIDERKIKSIIRLFARYYGVDLKSLRKNYGDVIGQKNSVPLPFTPDLILVPVKMRRPLTPYDGSSGFFTLNEFDKIIEDTVEGERKVNILLKSGYKLPCLCSKSTVEKHIRNAKIVHQHYLKLNYRNQNQLLFFCDVFSDYKQPATKGDIAILAKEILELKEKLL
ncbi:MAG: hypothetical protein PWQ82_1040 [Thermosediminibacterales bacterium]|nr:hypothetical protein [Thermosediminibacterales bacterium]MDK2836716.1 hypothetical protein [Thermosediminibacterales bacterium]